MVKDKFMLISTYFYYFCEMWHSPVEWLSLIQSIMAGRLLSLTELRTALYVTATCIIMFIMFYKVSKEVCKAQHFQRSTDACLHYRWNDICVANDSGAHFHFCSLVEASTPLKVLSFTNFFRNFIKHYEHYDACSSYIKSSLQFC